MWFGLNTKPTVQTDCLTEQDEQLFKRIAVKVVEHQMTVPTILFLESVKPLNFIGSQMMIFFQPIIEMVFTLPEYERFAFLIENRDHMERFIVTIEETEAEYQQNRKKKKELA